MSVPLGDAHSLADEILRVLEDEDLIRVLGEQGRRLVKEQTWEKVAEFTLSQILKIGM
jgi:glycosyltransferase involved in cell wall biosynthesis